MSLETPNTAANLLLAALSTEEYARVEPQLRPVVLTLGDIIYRREEVLEYVYFPLTAVISLLNDLEDGTGVEVGLVGFEGVAGVSATIGAVENKIATIQHTGTALRLDAKAFRDEFHQRGALHEMVLRYMYALSSQISQSVVCNVRHSIEQRLIRWLLMHYDRVRDETFTLTQEFIAAMLGVRRAGVSEAAKNLQQGGLINYTRGHIHIVDKAALEQAGCECYRVVRRDFERIYSGPLSAPRKLPS
jgi:CRP-like cAMP-binding protein